jgi:hypothetical protein
LVNVEELKPHEEVIEKTVATLAKEIEKEGRVRDPLMVDRDDYVILDGMHRHSSLKLLKCRFVPCCLLDYVNPQIKVGAWFRMFNANDARGLAERMLSETKLNYSKRQESPVEMNYDAESVILTNDGTVFTFPPALRPLERSRIAVDIEKRMVKEGYEVAYHSETVAMQRLKSGDRNFMIALPLFAKNQIREFALGGQLLPHKVTRHVIPSRPLAIDVPLQLLMNQAISQPEADRKLGELLAGRTVERRPAGSVIDGRHYDEELLIFCR